MKKPEEMNYFIICMDSSIEVDKSLYKSFQWMNPQEHPSVNMYSMSEEDMTPFLLKYANRYHYVMPYSLWEKHFPNDPSPDRWKEYQKSNEAASS